GRRRAADWLPGRRAGHRPRRRRERAGRGPVRAVRLSAGEGALEDGVACEISWLLRGLRGCRSPTPAPPDLDDRGAQTRIGAPELSRQGPGAERARVVLTYFIEIEFARLGRADAERRGAADSLARGRPRSGRLAAGPPFRR